MAVVIHAFRVGLAETPRALAIVGGGAIGGLSLILAKLRGVPKVCVVDVNDARLEAARSAWAPTSRSTRSAAGREARSCASGRAGEPTP